MCPVAIRLAFARSATRSSTLYLAVRAAVSTDILCVLAKARTSTRCRVNGTPRERAKLAACLASASASGPRSPWCTWHARSRVLSFTRACSRAVESGPADTAARTVSPGRIIRCASTVAATRSRNEDALFLEEEIGDSPSFFEESTGSSRVLLIEGLCLIAGQARYGEGHWLPRVRSS